MHGGPCTGLILWRVRRNRPRIDGRKLDLVLENAGTVVICDHQAALLHTLVVPQMLDFATTESSVIVFAANRIHHFDRASGLEIGSTQVADLNPAGFSEQSSTQPNIVVWHAPQPRVIKWTSDSHDFQVEAPPVVGTWLLPLSESRWLAWQSGQLRLWRSIGDMWRSRIGDPNVPVTAGQLVLQGRLLVLIQKHNSEIRLVVVAMNDGTLHTTVRLEKATDIQFAPSRGYATARIADKLVVIDLRFGRIIRELSLPLGTSDFAIDGSMQRVAVFDGDNVAIVAADSLTAEISRQQDELKAAQDAAIQATAETQLTGEAPVAPLPVAITAADEPDAQPALEVTPWAEAPDIVDFFAERAALNEASTSSSEPVASVVLSELPTAPLLRLLPRNPETAADPAEAHADLEAALDQVLAMAGCAFARAWDSGRLSQQTDDTLLYEYEVDGLMQRRSDLAQSHVIDAAAYLVLAGNARIATTAALGNRTTPLAQLQRDFLAYYSRWLSANVLPAQSRRSSVSH
jgi:hypothetical protein